MVDYHLDIIMSYLFLFIILIMAIYSTKKLIEDIIRTFDGEDNFGATVLIGLLLVCWGVVISYLALYHVFPWLDSL